jgi:transcriptional regulator GlxA family with amidase domain
MHLTQLETYAFKTALGAITQQLGHSVIEELQPIIDAIAASQRDGGFFTDRDVSVTLPATQGKTLVVSVRTASPRLTPLREQLRLVDGAIHEKIGEPLSVSMLSSIAGLSRSHFSHVFRATVGRTPHAHIVRLRIQRAMKLMVDTDVPLSEVALATGFSDQAHFSNTFRRTLGITPKQWRREQRSPR